jgi:hypothetical protein
MRSARSIPSYAVPTMAASSKRICQPVKYKHVRIQKRQACLVADLLEVLAELDDRVEGVGRLDRVGVVGDEEGLCGLVGNDAFLALRRVSVCLSWVGARTGRGWRTFFALSESSDASMVMYFSPLTLTPFAMTALVSLLSLNEAAMALISAAVSWSLSVLCSWYAHMCGERTEKSGDEAHVVWPLTSQMRALSMLPVPTRLQRAC